MNVSKIATMALKQLGILAAGESAEASELADAVDSLRGLLAQWATDRLYVHKAQILTLRLSKGIGTYLIGKIEGDCCEYELTCCGDVLLRPDLKAEISHISDRARLDGKEITLVRDLNNTALKNHVQVWYQADAPNWVFHVRENAKELKIKVYTLPFELCAHDELHLPQNYERALILSLALEVAPMFGVEPSITLAANQRNALSLLQSSNITPIYAKNDLPVGGGYGDH
ncbi:hypothetical protein BEN74_18760 [Acinetobacter sp. WCHAc010034]|uniref:hypothetical protein n=1 Tax=Acinetobacter sp. WCHAc010034 TaxID=1879049 RepID=UPI00083AAA62|nr:hypothetical protein [Acinetobacter sp. WCHAc010034]AYA04624.1 hypothetical protein BEN74_18760 [Acinetobacter sp. WCHAc010034]